MIRRMLSGLIACIALVTVPAVAQAEIFMLVTGVAGDVTAKGHEKWIRVSSLDWTVEATTSWTQGGGASVGKPRPDAIDLIVPTGPWSQHFIRLITQGKALPNVVFDAVASDGRPLYRVTAEGFFVTEYRLANLPASPLPQDHLSGVFKKVKIEYYAVGADGRVTSSIVEWDVASGISTPGI